MFIDVLAGNLSFRINCKRKTATMILIFEPRMTHIVQVFFHLIMTYDKMNK